jgi:hypothetical protein
MTNTYFRILGVEFLQTTDAPLTHVKIHPLVLADLLTSTTVDSALDVFVHHMDPVEITMQEKLEQVKARRGVQ